MTLFTPAFRLTVYEPRSEQSNPSTEPDILSPIGGAAHSDTFRVATMTGIANFQPYLMLPTGKKGKLDPLSKKTTVGQMTFGILDKRTTTGGSNASRWVTAFLGGTRGENRLLGCKVLCEQSLNGGSTWTAWFTGRITAVSLDGYATLTLQCRDLSAEFKRNVFVGRPHANVTYAVEPQLWPLGLSGAYGALPLAPVLTGVVGNASVGGGKSVTLTAASQRDPNNVVNNLLRSFDVRVSLHQSFPPGYVQSSKRVRAVLTGGATGRFAVQGVIANARSIPERIVAYQTGYEVREILIAALDPTDRDYLAMPADSTSVNIALVAEAPDSGEPTKEAPLLINDVHVGTLWRDLLEGEWSPLLPTGAVRRAFAYDTTAFTTLVADTTLPLARFVIDRSWPMWDFVEKQICQPFGLGYRINGSGQVVPIDMRLPDALAGLPTITDDDLAGPDAVQWSQGVEGAITTLRVTTYYDQPQTVGDFALEQGIAQVASSSLIQSVSDETWFRDDFREDMGEEEFVINALGLRYATGEYYQNQTRQKFVEGFLTDVSRQYRHPFSTGPAEAALACRRTTVTDAIDIGTWCVLDVDPLPNAGTNLRGGARLMRCVERNDGGLTVDLVLLDAGPNATAAVPTVGALGAGSDAAHQITVPITLNAAGDPVTLQVAATETSVGAVGSVPAAAWRTVQVVTASATVTVFQCPAGKRIWVRARSDRRGTGDTALPSAWVFSSGADFQDTTTITAPSALASSAVSTLAFTLTWTNGSSTELIEVSLASPTAGTFEVVRILPPGTTRYDVTGTTAAATYDARVRHVDGLGGSSAYSSTVTVTATGTPPVCDTPVRLTVGMELA